MLNKNVEQEVLILHVRLHPLREFLCLVAVVLRILGVWQQEVAQQTATEIVELFHRRFQLFHGFACSILVLLFDRLVEKYAYLGNMVMVSAVDVRKIAMYVDAYGKSRTNRYGRDKMGNEWENDLRTVAEIAEEMATNRNNDIASLKSQGWEPGNSGSFKLAE